MKATWIVTAEQLNNLVIQGLKQGHTMKEVHEILDKYRIVIVKGGE